MSNDKNLTKPSYPLVQLYIDALTNIITSMRAKNAANLSEEELLQNLRSLGTRNGVYMTPDQIPQDQVDGFVKESVNAHLTKVQSQQLEQTTSGIVSQSEQEAKTKYVGRKVVVTKINTKSDVFDAVYADQQYQGGFRISKYTGKQVKGKIRDIVFDKNLLVVEPSFLAKKLTPNRLFIHAYVVNLDDMTPDVTISV